MPAGSAGVSLACSKRGGHCARHATPEHVPTEIEWVQDAETWWHGNWAARCRRCKRADRHKDGPRLLFNSSRSVMRISRSPFFCRARVRRGPCFAIILLSSSRMHCRLLRCMSR